MQSKPNTCRVVQVAQRPWLDHLPTTPVGQHARWPCGGPGVCMCTQPRAQLGLFQGSPIRMAQPSTEPQSRAWNQGISRLCWSMQAQQPPIFRGRRPRTLAAITRASTRLWCRGVQIWIMSGWRRKSPHCVLARRQPFSRQSSDKTNGASSEHPELGKCRGIRLPRNERPLSAW